MYAACIIMRGRSNGGLFRYKEDLTSMGVVIV